MSEVLVQQIKAEVHLRIVEESIPRIIQCLDLLTQEQIWYRPNDNSNAIGNLVLHLCGNVRQYLISSIGGKADGRERQKEFDSRDQDKTYLKAELATLKSEVAEAIPFITDTALIEERSVQGFNMTGTSVVVHVIEHFSYHTGQIAYITKMLLDQDLAFYGGMDLDVVG